MSNANGYANDIQACIALKSSIMGRVSRMAELLQEVASIAININPAVDDPIAELTKIEAAMFKMLHYTAATFGEYVDYEENGKHYAEMKKSLKKMRPRYTKLSRRAKDEMIRNEDIMDTYGQFQMGANLNAWSPDDNADNGHVDNLIDFNFEEEDTGSDPIDDILNMLNG